AAPPATAPTEDRGRHEQGVPTRVRRRPGPSGRTTLPDRPAVSSGGGDSRQRVMTNWAGSPGFVAIDRMPPRRPARPSTDSGELVSPASPAVPGTPPESGPATPTGQGASGRPPAVPTPSPPAAGCPESAPAGRPGQAPVLRP